MNRKIIWKEKNKKKIKEFWIIAENGAQQTLLRDINKVLREGESLKFEENGLVFTLRIGNKKRPVIIKNPMDILPFQVFFQQDLCGIFTKNVNYPNGIIVLKKKKIQRLSILQRIKNLFGNKDSSGFIPR